MPLNRFNNFDNAGEHKLSELFDIQKRDGEGPSQYRQRLRGAADHYQATYEVKAMPMIEQIQDVEYEVTGHDTHLSEYIRKRGITLKSVTIGTRRPAEKVLTSQLAKENKPRMFIDPFGNIWEARKLSV